MNKIDAISAFQDNYIWAIHSPEGNQIVVVDPGDANPVLSYLQTNRLDLAGILLTHHHWDHSGGIPALGQLYPDIPAYGPRKEKVPGITHFVQEGDIIKFPGFDLTLNVLDIPGHTLGHIAYFNENILFCGDTLFSCGCGRVFEGTPEMMVNTLEKIKNLPVNTNIYCGHEYTLANIKFAKIIEPANNMLEKRLQESLFLRNQNLPSLPVSLESELQTNPFLRIDAPQVIQSVQNHSKIQENDKISIFAHLRQWKNQF